MSQEDLLGLIQGEIFDLVNRYADSATSIVRMAAVLSVGAAMAEEMNIPEEKVLALVTEFYRTARANNTTRSPIILSH